MDFHFPLSIESQYFFPARTWQCTISYDSILGMKFHVFKGRMEIQLHIHILCPYIRKT